MLGVRQSRLRRYKASSRSFIIRSLYYTTLIILDTFVLVLRDIVTTITIISLLFLKAAYRKFQLLVETQLIYYYTFLRISILLLALVQVNRFESSLYLVPAIRSTNYQRRVFISLSTQVRLLIKISVLGIQSSAASTVVSLSRSFLLQTSFIALSTRKYSQSQSPRQSLSIVFRI